MEENTMLSIAVDHIINAENFVIVGDQVNAYAARKLPGIDHGIGGIGEIVVYITGITKYIDIYGI